jgi:REP element-mobilizing transposase RayT
MASTHLSLHYHVVFSTKNRLPVISSTWRERLHAYLGGVLKNLNAVPEAIGGTNDNVHILFGLRATHCLADVVRDLKSTSSRWMHQEIRDYSAEWQDGYGAFTVGAPQCADVCDYIVRQEEHHRKRTFQEEYVDFLRRGLVEFDERYLW